MDSFYYFENVIKGNWANIQCDSPYTPHHIELSRGDGQEKSVMSKAGRGTGTSTSKEREIND